MTKKIGILGGEPTRAVDVGASDLGEPSVPGHDVTRLPVPAGLAPGAGRKAGLQWAIDHDFDVVVVLPSHRPVEVASLTALVAPLEADRCDAVIGTRAPLAGNSRRATPSGAALATTALRRVANALVGTSLRDWRSEYRSYDVASLAALPFHQCSDGPDFDVELTIQFHEVGATTVEVPIPFDGTGPDQHSLDLGAARRVVVDAGRYRLHRMGFGTGETAFAHSDYEMKLSADSSHGQILRLLAGRPPARVLDLGCATGRLGEALRREGHRVVGVDTDRAEGVENRLDAFHQADLDQGIPTEVDGAFDIVMAADVLEHLRDPEQLLAEARQRLNPGGVVVASIPNFAHWYPRVRVLVGRFDYDQRGILDRGHVRFFTQASFERLVRRAGYGIVQRTDIGLPLEVADRGTSTEVPVSRSRPGDMARRLDRAAVAAWPTLFGYQFVYELVPA